MWSTTPTRLPGGGGAAWPSPPSGQQMWRLEIRPRVRTAAPKRWRTWAWLGEHTAHTGGGGGREQQQPGENVCLQHLHRTFCSRTYWEVSAWSAHTEPSGNEPPAPDPGPAQSPAPPQGSASETGRRDDGRHAHTHTHTGDIGGSGGSM